MDIFFLPIFPVIFNNAINKYADYCSKIAPCRSGCWYKHNVTYDACNTHNNANGPHIPYARNKQWCESSNEIHYRQKQFKMLYYNILGFKRIRQHRVINMMV